MYKNFIPWVFFLVVIVTLFSCKTDKKKNKYERHVRVYQNALRLGDLNVAINACYEIIANDSKRTNYYDTLVYLYLNTRNQGSTYLAARTSLIYNPNDDKITRIAADYAKTLGMPDTAIMYYRKTFVLNNLLENLYNVAQVQCNAGNYAGAEETVDQIIKSPYSEKEKIYIQIDKETNQQIPIKAAALNVKGTIFSELGNNEIALRYIDEALKITPDFKVALNNKEEIMSQKIKSKK